MRRPLPICSAASPPSDKPHSCNVHKVLDISRRTVPVSSSMSASPAAPGAAAHCAWQRATMEDHRRMRCVNNTKFSLLSCKTGYPSRLACPGTAASIHDCGGQAWKMPGRPQCLCRPPLQHKQLMPPACCNQRGNGLCDGQAELLPTCSLDKPGCGGGDKRSWPGLRCH